MLLDRVISMAFMVRRPVPHTRLTMSAEVRISIRPPFLPLILPSWSRMRVFWHFPRLRGGSLPLFIEFWSSAALAGGTGELAGGAGPPLSLQFLHFVVVSLG